MKKSAALEFSKVTECFASDPDVLPGKMFGAEGLKINGKVFAMLVKGELVIKLPAARCAELISAGRAARFDPGHGRQMREWVQVPLGTLDWIDLASEARHFVGRLGSDPRGEE